MQPVSLTPDECFECAERNLIAVFAGNVEEAIVMLTEDPGTENIRHF